MMMSAGRKEDKNFLKKPLDFLKKGAILEI